MERTSRKPVFNNRHCIRRPARSGSNIEAWFAVNATGLPTNTFSYDHGRRSGDAAYSSNLNGTAIAQAAIASENTCFNLPVRNACETVRKFSVPPDVSISIGRKSWATAWPGIEGFVRRVFNSVAIPVQTFIGRAVDGYYYDPEIQPLHGNLYAIRQKNTLN